MSNKDRNENQIKEIIEHIAKLQPRNRKLLLFNRETIGELLIEKENLPITNQEDIPMPSNIEEPKPEKPEKSE